MIIKTNRKYLIENKKDVVPFLQIVSVGLFVDKSPKSNQQNLSILMKPSYI